MNFELWTFMKPAYQRILLKISGEALMGERNYGIDTNVAEAVGKEIKAVYNRLMFWRKLLREKSENTMKKMFFSTNRLLKTLAKPSAN